MSENYLNVLDEEGNILRQAIRTEIHEQGLLHGEAHIWFYTPDGRIIFQHRGLHKDTWPNLLDATAGGHVEIGDTYEETAVKEVEEETGIPIKLSDLVFLRTTITNSFDSITGMTNHPRRNVYAYCFRGQIADLKVEGDKALGFEAWPIQKLQALSPAESVRFIPAIINAEGQQIFAQIQQLIEAQKENARG